MTVFDDYTKKKNYLCYLYCRSVDKRISPRMRLNAKKKFVSKMLWVQPTTRNEVKAAFGKAVACFKENGMYMAHFRYYLEMERYVTSTKGKSTTEDIKTVYKIFENRD